MLMFGDAYFFAHSFFKSEIVGSFSSVYWLAYSLLFFPLVLNSIYAPIMQLIPNLKYISTK